ncbi:alpha-mannosidase [Bacillus sp. J14TS2]|uniref:glycoside hydrolase family 38 C-terminal domain-containing protein n=1 Tax=Bacillus sp. J14TS2 TaxID=2807188 RepID=UPI001B0DD670|nr:glycoside hydrolase family 38 C-terminal domain-containing protein [Bacillus sp. J14TS2]GIN71206.1 alpha-mannosidase [Bacillus sp. J14TS2]
MTKKAYFVDGYHGGVKGHMPLGSWADVLSKMAHNPDWKIGLDIEPISWEVLKRTDPKSYQTLHTYLKDNGSQARVEMLAGSYAQPFGWVIGGESNIRHLIRGKEIIREHFPEAVVDTYATQEPCWSSSFPQILLSLGYKRAVLKNPGTAWGGYAATNPHEIVLWVGPDGSAIPCVPRYESEKLVNCWETEAAHMEEDFVNRSFSLGISHPIGSFLQDLGWPAQPKMENKEVQYVTWREYFEEIVDEPVHQWAFSQEDIRCTLPWGEGTLQKMAREVRSAENKMIQAEKLAVLASVTRGLDYPDEKFRQAWDELLLSQHHDAWICATTQIGRRNWAWQAGVQSWNAETISRDIIETSMDAFRMEEGTDEAGITVFNTSGMERRDVVEIEIPTPVGTKAVRVTDQQGNERLSQIVPSRHYQADDSINAGKLLFQAEVPAMGYRTFTITPITYPKRFTDMVQVTPNTVRIETDIYELEIDTARGGVITKVYDKGVKKEFVRDSAEGLNEYSGYFITEERWVSSTESPVEVMVKENGPLRATVEMKGKMANVDIITTISVINSEKKIDVHVRLHYKEQTWIGDPWDIEPENRRTERRRSHHNDQYKLSALFPVSLDNGKLYKNAAFDVTESRNDHTHFTRWDEIKHTILLHWLDVYDEQQDCGFAIFSDHTTGYSHAKGEPLALTLGWGWEGGFWWGKCPLEGQKEINYSLLPHCGRWDQAGVHQEYSSWAEPFVAMLGTPELDTYSLIQVSDPAIEVTTLLRDGEDVLVRLFNTGPERKTTHVRVNCEVGEAEKVELDGKFKDSLVMQAGTDGGFETEITLAGFGLSTIRLCKVKE